jgi:hypothetical protein
MADDIFSTCFSVELVDNSLGFSFSTGLKAVEHSGAKDFPTVWKLYRCRIPIKCHKAKWTVPMVCGLTVDLNCVDHIEVDKIISFASVGTAIE